MTKFRIEIDIHGDNYGTALLWALTEVLRDVPLLVEMNAGDENYRSIACDGAHVDIEATRDA